MADFAIEIPPGIDIDDTSHFVGSKCWRDAEKVRFVRGLPEVIGGWERLQPDALTGVCRAVLGWSDGLGTSFLAFGTHTSLQVNYGGALYDITPTLARPSTLLGASPLTVTNGSPTVTVDHPAHGLATGALIQVSGAVAVGGITPNLASVAVTVLDVDRYTYAFTSSATSAAIGGGSAVLIQPLEAFAAGAEHGTGGAGYGTGGYSLGGYSEPSTASYYPRTWSLQSWGSSLMANPRGGAIHWSRDVVDEDRNGSGTATGAAALVNSPRQVTTFTVAEQRQVIAYGCNEEESGDFNPMCIRGSDLEEPLIWSVASDNMAFEEVLEGGGRLVGSANMGARQVCWSDKALYVGTFIGSPDQVWRYEMVADSAGLVGPNARVVLGQRAYWITPAGKLMGYVLGGEPQEIVSPVIAEMWRNLATSQGDKITASSFATAREVRFDYPDARDGEGLENSRYVSFVMGGPASAVSELAWSRGTMARTAYMDAGPQGYPVGVDPAGVAYWHERGLSDDGGRFTAWVETADLYADDGAGSHVYADMLIPDFHNQQCPVSVTWIGRSFPQSAENQGATSASGRNYGPFVCTAGDERVGARAEGRLVRLRFESYSAQNAWRLGRCVFNMQPTGRR